MAQIPAEATDLLEAKNFAYVATLLADGSPQVSAVWIDDDGHTVVFNAASRANSA